MYLAAASVTLLAPTVMGMHGAVVPALTNEVREMANYGMLFHLSRGASNHFDPNLRGNSRGAFSEKYYHTINAADCTTAVLRMGHGMAHNHMNANRDVFLTHGATMTDAEFTTRCRQLRTAYTQIIEVMRGTMRDANGVLLKDAAGNDVTHPQYTLPEMIEKPKPVIPPRWLVARMKLRDAYYNITNKRTEIHQKWAHGVIPHWEAYGAELDALATPAAAGAAGAGLMNYDVTRVGAEHVVKFARISVILSLSRKVMDYYSNDQSPLYKARNNVDGDLDKTWKKEIIRMGQCVAHCKSQRRYGLEIEDYTFLFTKLEVALTTLQDLTDHSPIPYGALTTADDGCDGANSNPILDALALINLIKDRGNPGVPYVELRPCCDTYEMFRQNQCGANHISSRAMRANGEYAPYKFCTKYGAVAQAAPGGP